MILSIASIELNRKSLNVERLLVSLDLERFIAKLLDQTVALEL